jgi:hypothetical protein
MLPLTKASVHSVLLNLSWCIFVLIQIGRRIDRWCPHLDRQIIRCYCLLQLYSFQSPDATRIWNVGSSDGTSFVWPSTQCTKCTDALPRVPSVHLTVSFSFFFSASLTCHYFNFTYLTCHHCSSFLCSARGYRNWSDSFTISFHQKEPIGLLACGGMPLIKWFQVN